MWSRPSPSSIHHRHPQKCTDTQQYCIACSGGGRTTTKIRRSKDFEFDDGENENCPKRIYISCTTQVQASNIATLHVQSLDVSEQQTRMATNNKCTTNVPLMVTTLSSSSSATLLLLSVGATAVVVGGAAALFSTQTIASGSKSALFKNEEKCKNQKKKRKGNGNKNGGNDSWWWWWPSAVRTKLTSQKQQQPQYKRCEHCGSSARTTRLENHAVINASSRNLSLVQQIQYEKRINLPKIIILVRHGESESNADHTLWRTKPDNMIELSSKGIEQAKQVGKRIEDIFQYCDDNKIDEGGKEGRRTEENDDSSMDDSSDDSTVRTRTTSSSVTASTRNSLRDTSLSDDSNNNEEGTS